MPQSTTASSPTTDLGLPAAGAGSLAPLGRRLIALCIDWFASLAIAIAFLGYHLGASGGITFRPLLVFAVMQIVLVGTVGTSLGHRLAGIRVTALSGGPCGPASAVLRTLLICLAIPPLVWDNQGRGLHDILARTVVVRS